jgi:hypothetical protein
MKTFDKNGNNDTFLTGGLIAIAIAWIAFSALQGPATTRSAPASTGMVAASGATALRASANPHAVALPSERQRTAGNKVS